MMNLIEISVMVGILVIVIIVIRSLFLNHLPKITFPILWGVVLMRLLLPFSFDTEWSLNAFSRPFFTNDVSVDGAMPNDIEENIVVENQSVNNQMEFPNLTNTPDLLTTRTAPVVTGDSNQINWLVVIWLAGIALSAIYFTFGHWKDRQNLSTAVMLETEFLNNWKSEQKLKRSLSVLMSDQVTTPLTFGILKPKIIIPAAMDIQNNTNFHYVLAHEFYHIKRVDALWKLLAVIVVCIHWFNPFVWIAFVLANRDLEISCDAWVMKKFKKNTKKMYAYALISMAEYQNEFTPLYNNFARHAIEERVETIMKTKKTTVIGAITAFALIGLLAFTAFAAPADGEYDYDEPVERTEEGFTVEAPSGITEEGFTVEAPSGMTEEWFTVEAPSEMTEEESTELAEMLAEMLAEEERNSTRLDYHLSEEEARAIGIQWIYEEFGVVIDAETADHFYMRFSHEDMSGGERSFWTGSGWAGEGLFSNDFTHDHLFIFSIDGVTGERVIIVDQMQVEAFTSEVVLGHMQVTVFDETEIDHALMPSTITELQPYHVSVEEVVALIAEEVYEKCGVNLDGRVIHMGFRGGFWSANIVPRHHDEAQIGFAIDARTGEIISASASRDSYTGGEHMMLEDGCL